MKVFENIDCMEGMKRYPDKYFELAIVDPPYGIGEDGVGLSRHNPEGQAFTIFKPKKWDKKRPGGNYFNELFRISQNQIIWGGNYFAEFLPASMGWIFWLILN